MPRHPETEAIGTDNKLADRSPQAAAAGVLADFAAAGVVLELGKWSAQGARHPVLGDQTRCFVGCDSQQREVRRGWSLGQSRPERAAQAEKVTGTAAKLAISAAYPPRGRSSAEWPAKGGTS
jgi:hypothetical protein